MIDASDSKIFNKKLRRIRAGGHIRVLDLFAGCGGLSLGFQKAGFAISASVENDPIAARTHARNFFKEEQIHAHAIDITSIEPDQLTQFPSFDQTTDLAIDVLIGGPPCQAFARVGRAKLREIALHPAAFQIDPRANLYLRYLHFVKALRPLAVLMENVPDVLNFGGHNIPEEVSEFLNELGYECRYTILNSAFFGVPQMRERMFLLAYHRILEQIPEFPGPSHHVELPRGYEGSRQVALKYLRCRDLLSPSPHFVEPISPSPLLPPAVTAAEALADLPPITVHLEGRLKRGLKRVDEITPYGPKTPSPYARIMRKWPGFEGRGAIGHVIRYLPRDYPIFRRMNPGDEYPAAKRHAEELLREEIERLAANGISIHEGTEEYASLRKRIVPGYDAGKFPNKWRKMEAAKPARTLMAHLGKDGYSHIHYDSAQARTISVREAARLQSFPDGFVFEGTMNPAFRQIGNAVPPLMAYAIASRMKEVLIPVEYGRISDQTPDKIGSYTLRLSL
jgi:DNA (cytosine-5)-methyltransferase 1